MFRSVLPFGTVANLNGGLVWCGFRSCQRRRKKNKQNTMSNLELRFCSSSLAITCLSLRLFFCANDAIGDVKRHLALMSVKSVFYMPFAAPRWPRQVLDGATMAVHKFTLIPSRQFGSIHSRHFDITFVETLFCFRFEMKHSFSFLI